MKKSILSVLIVIMITMCFSVSLASSSSPVGVWVLACRNEKSTSFYIYVFNSDGTAMVYEMIPTWSITGVAKIKWSLSGEKIKYTVIEKDKGYSASVPVKLSFEANLTFKDGTVYNGKNAMTKIEFHNYSK